MKLNDLITKPTEHNQFVDLDSPVMTIDELLVTLQHIRQEHGNLPCVVTGYEMGIDELVEARVVQLWQGGGGCCGTFEDDNVFDSDGTPFKAVLLPR